MKSSSESLNILLFVSSSYQLLNPPSLHISLFFALKLPKTLPRHLLDVVTYHYCQQYLIDYFIPFFQKISISKLCHSKRLSSGEIACKATFDMPRLDMSHIDDIRKWIRAKKRHRIMRMPEVKLSFIRL